MTTAERSQTQGTRARERWDNEGGHVAALSSPHADALELQLHQYGIVPVQLTVFDWGGYRYSNARDALAAAKRDAR
jgi:hypothetical protein